MTLSATFSNILHLFSITYWCAIEKGEDRTKVLGTIWMKS